MKKSNIYIFIGLVFLAFIFFGFGWKIGKSQSDSQVNIIKEIRENNFNQEKFQYINPLLTCELGSSVEEKSFTSLKAKINNLINSKITDPKDESVSVYFDTRDGRWLSINTKAEYNPASLLKVPLMIAAFKIAESEPNFLSKKILYTGQEDHNLEQNYKPAEVMLPNQYYTVDDLVSRTIIFSDNNAMKLLLANMNLKELEVLYNVYTNLGFDPNATEIGVKSYASFFRVLYNGTYLSREMSEKAMELLSKTNFSEGIEAGLPGSITLADKFGERNITDTANQSVQRELHDCGIIYYPDHPYLLCIMTKGKDFDKLSGIIKDVSALVYKNMDDLVQK
ncbi:MAG: class A beta-lactamase-related serine hydrolase [Candidatus Magasanikbacteria bacterium]|nr:class A beta-lactamase-related serine hydrolase [Candidatus Magasanikbacteria bacterium]